MVGWFVSEGGPAWKQSWSGRTLSSVAVAPPPLPLVAVFSIVVFYLYLSDSYQTALFGLKVFLFVLPIVIIFLARNSAKDGRSGVLNPTPQYDSLDRGAGTSPWRVALLLLLLLVLISYHPSLKSKWFAPLSSSN